MKRLTLLLAVFYLLNACKGSISVKQDLSNGISTSGLNLTCENVEVYQGEAVSESNKYHYGTPLSMKFIDIMGFESINGRVFPGMKMTVANSEGKTVFSVEDLYADEKNGFEESASLDLTADLVLASPIFSGEKYVLTVMVWDKKSNGKFTAKYPFSVGSNEQIAIESNSGQLAMDEVYLFSESSKQTITDNVLSAGDKVSVIIDGMLPNFTESDGVISFGMSLLITDAEGNTLEENLDLFSDYDETGISAAEIGEKLSVSFNVPDASASPIHVVIEIWDKFVPEESVTINFDAEIE
ncbi:MAG: hypothetical protein K0R65_25 [Crocinitomicaceae bacterium]|jgi:hypothetical protein|nr:hypothetical protein [Crocinitomicaceae bacterium]